MKPPFSGPDRGRGPSSAASRPSSSRRPTKSLSKVANGTDLLQLVKGAGSGVTAEADDLGLLAGRPSARRLCSWCSVSHAKVLPTSGSAVD
eukprot:7643203-Alexandrium_andersonii.AAC.1